jgi:hypothetical protein
MLHAHIGSPRWDRIAHPLHLLLAGLSRWPEILKKHNETNFSVGC